jgi:long-subunit acyl-CoA synthetase (AMP-forming)
MSLVLEAIEQHARHAPRAAALCGASQVLSYAELAQAIDRLAAHWRRAGIGTAALALDNGPAWAVADLAASAAGVTLVPLPTFFSPAQLRHVLDDAGVEAVLSDDSAPVRQLLENMPPVEQRTIDLAGQACRWSRLRANPGPMLPAGTTKLTYTSGTTGTPKGVCLSQSAQDAVARSLLERVGDASVVQHLSLLPLATLLENIAGVYLPLLAGATAHLLPLSAVGLRGAAGLDAGAMIAALRERQATSAILIPQMLHALVREETTLPAACFFAVGGAPVAPRLLSAARSLGLPVYEGYGLSECASVVSVNAPGDERPGSVGRPLAHARLRIGSDGEILVAGSVFAGYHGQESALVDGYVATGDVGYLDRDGFLHLTGRKKNMFITAFGRNVAPEWVERELTLHPAIGQAAVFGEARPWNVAVIARGAGATLAQIDAAVAGANRELPDYARVRAWVEADAPFSLGNGQLTSNGRLRRAQILAAYDTRLDQLYDRSHHQEVVA